MGIEGKKNFTRSLKEETVDAVKEGTALPTREGLNDPEILEAFEERLLSMNEDEVLQLENELKACAEELNTNTYDKHKWAKVKEHTTHILGIFSMGATGVSLASGNYADLGFFIPMALAMETIRGEAAKRSKEIADSFERSKMHVDGIIDILNEKNS